MSEDTMRIDRHMPGTRLYRLVTQKVTEILNAMPDASGRRDPPGRPDTSVPAVGRRTARAATGAGSPPRPSGSPWRWRGGGSGRPPGACARRRRGTAYLLPEFPAKHRRKIRTNNMIERLNREIRRRTRVVGGFPYGDSALMLACARIRYVTANE